MLRVRAPFYLHVLPFVSALPMVFLSFKMQQKPFELYSMQQNASHLYHAYVNIFFFYYFVVVAVPSLITFQLSWSAIRWYCASSFFCSGCAIHFLCVFMHTCVCVCVCVTSNGNYLRFWRALVLFYNQHIWCLLDTEIQIE